MCFIFIFASSAQFYNMGSHTHFVKFCSLDLFFSEKKVEIIPHENYPLYGNCLLVAGKRDLIVPLRGTCRSECELNDGGIAIRI